MAKVTPAKSRTPFYVLIAVVVVVAGTLIWNTVRQGSNPTSMELPAGAELPPAEGQLRGNANAPVTIVEFADFECPVCGTFASLQEPDIRTRLIDSGYANLRFQDYPLTEIHGNTLVAHLAASCAADQGKFWEMHDAIFSGQYDWNTQATKEPRRELDKYATQVGLNMDQYDECLSSRKNLPKIMANRKAGEARGVNSTPTFVIGDRVYPGSMTFDQIKKIVDSLRAAGPATPVPQVVPTAPTGDRQ